MWGAQVEDVAQRRYPRVAPLLCIVAGAASNQTTHRMTDQDQLGDGDGPGGGDIVEQTGEMPAVLGDVETGVVAQVDRGVPEVVGEPRTIGGLGAAAVAIGVQPPRLLGFAQAVNENRHFRGRLREGDLERVAPRCDIGSGPSDRHRDRQRAALVGKLISQGGIEYRQGQIAPGSRPGRTG